MRFVLRFREFMFTLNPKPFFGQHLRFRLQGLNRCKGRSIGFRVQHSMLRAWGNRFRLVLGWSSLFAYWVFAGNMRRYDVMSVFCIEYIPLFPTNRQ